MENIIAVAKKLIPNYLKKIASAGLYFIGLKKPDQASTLRIGTFSGFEVAYRKNTADEQVIAHSFKNDIFFAAVPDYKPVDGHVIIDIGAHIGTFSLLAASKVKSGKVFAVEPCEDTFNLLRINAALNKADNISAQRTALSDKKGTCTLYYDKGNWGHSIVRPLSRHGETVEICTLAYFMEKNEISACDFMKVNCEGAEFPIILSTPIEMLKKFGVILVLYHSFLWKKNAEADLLFHLKSCGFRTALSNVCDERGWLIAINENRTGK